MRAYNLLRKSDTTDHVTPTRASVPIDACLREPFSGIGKPERFKYGAQGSWSRRITDEHRLVYQVDDENLVILQARYYY